MAKKTATKKKAAPAKAKPATKATKNSKASKPVKAVAKAPVKAAKSASTVKVAPQIKAAANKVAPAKVETKAVSKPSLMTKKGKTVEVEPIEVKKTATIVSLLETDASADAAKVEKTSKVKPVKVDRGNLNDEKAKWAELNKKYGKEKALTYKMTETYPSLVPLQHKVLGWGFILTNDNDRLEVLFETGIRMLISNYKN